MAGQSANTRSGGNQKRALCATLPSFCGTIDWHHTARMLGPNALLDVPGLGLEAARVSGLLQLPSGAFIARGTHAAAAIRSKNSSEPRLLSMAATLWRSISNAHCCLM